MGDYGIILFAVLAIAGFILWRKGVLDKGAQAVIDKAEPLADKVHEKMAPVGDAIDNVADKARDAVKAKLDEMKK